ncbi:MAG: peptide chain release factor N(5)-glutamine methyltransferase [Actinomycetota bacterium]|nr:peptide chain release factor N(5)-glutamine methyltransferase [Actinomycetota bacterium]
MAAAWTIATVLAAAKEHLDKNDFSSARREAELLLARALRLSRVDLYTQYDRPLSDDERGSFKTLLKARLERQPLQYIIGNQAFRYLELHVEPGVFIPRPETELLVERIIDAVRAKPGPLAVLELGMGSGAVCLSLAKELPDVHVWAVDISLKALTVTEGNAATHGLLDKVTLCQGDMFSALPAGSGLTFDVVAANPPYVPTMDIDGLEPEVRDHEPLEALDGGPTGVRFYETIAKQAPGYLRPGGLVAFEVGEGQAGAVSALLEGAGFSHIEIHKDYNDIERIVIGRCLN